jgi:fibronectin-binding autotransporter adhesin
MSLKVTTGIDSTNLGSLRSAITTANSIGGTEPIKIIITHHVKHIVVNLGNMTITTSIILLNESGHDVTITCDNNDGLFVVGDITTPNIFKIDGGKHRIIIEGSTANTSPYVNGAAISVSTFHNTLILKNVLITDCEASESGGAIYTLGNVMMESCDLYENMAVAGGGAIWSSGNVAMKNTRVHHNTISDLEHISLGGGIFVTGANLVIADDSHVDHNKCETNGSLYGMGGGIYMENGAVFVSKKSSVNHNTSFDSAGIHIVGGNVWVTDSQLKGNVGTNTNTSPLSGLGGSGGAIVARPGSVLISGSEVCDNKSAGVFSGGITCFQGNVTVQNKSKVNNNSSVGPGGGIFGYIACSIVVNDSEVSCNTASVIGGGIANFSEFLGGTSVCNSCIRNNKVTNAVTVQQFQHGGSGSGGFGTPPNVLMNLEPQLAKRATHKSTTLYSPDTPPHYAGYIGGGGIGALTRSDVSVVNSAVIENVVGVVVNQANLPILAFGGGIFAPESPIMLEASKVNHNTSSSNGGGLLADNTLVMHNTEIVGNNVKGDGSAVSDGGGVFNDLGSLMTSIDSIIKKNKTLGSGGGLTNYGYAHMFDSPVVDNHAKVGNNNVYSPGTINYL